jgi:hypothetical protein
MRAARAFVIAVALIVGVPAAVVLIQRAVKQMHTFTVPTLAGPGAQGSTHHAPRAARSAQSPPLHKGAPMRAGAARPTHKPDSSPGLLGRVALLILASIAVLCAMTALLAGRRTRRRHTRTYALYELHLSMHDQAKAQDLEDMIEQVVNIVRAWPADRALNGQPYFALELICGTAQAPGGHREMEWSINIRCQPQVAVALDGAISAAYPDVRLGRIHGEQPRPRPGRLRDPGYLMRFRKERSFVYSLIADGEHEASSPLEQIARAQIAQDAPSLVRFQLTPTPSLFEGLARRLYRRNETGLLTRSGGRSREGLLSTFDQAEMRAAERTQNRSLAWLETVVAADSREVCKAVAAAVQSRRGENRLHRRWMTIRQGLYRRRFSRALGPLIPSFRCLVSAAEVAHLLELPSARMKGVPVRRLTMPRIPAPPEIVRTALGPHIPTQNRTTTTSGEPSVAAERS